MSLPIRAAEPDDAEGIALVQTAAWREAYAGLLDRDFLARQQVAPDVWRQRLSQRDARTRVFVATDDGPVVGFAAAGPELDPTRDGLVWSGDTTVGQLYSIYVLAPFYGRAVGHRLHDAALAALVQNGFSSAVLWVLAGNHRAIAFYLRQGWSDSGAVRREERDGQGLDEHRYDLTAKDWHTSHRHGG